MENFSENDEPRKRGRPELFDRRMARVLDDGMMYSRRHLQNQFHATMFSILIPDELRKGDLAWLFEGDNTPRGRRMTVRAELGRLAATEHEMIVQIVVTVAREICEKKMPTKQALAYIRDWRRHIAGTPQPPGSAHELTNAIIDLLNDYLARNPRTTHDMMLQALSRVIGHVQKAAQAARQTDPDA